MAIKYAKKTCGKLDSKRSWQKIKQERMINSTGERNGCTILNMVVRDDFTEKILFDKGLEIEKQIV